MNFCNDLITRQWKLYEYLKNNKDRYVENKEIYEALKEYYPPLIPGQPFNNSNARRIITDDKLVLKNSDRIHYLIITNSKGTKLISKEEELNYLRRERSSTLKKLRTISKQLYKAQHHKQTRLTWNNEKDTIEAIIE